MKVSVVIPTLNSAALLDRTIESVRDADEIIVVDGGSTDATLAIAHASGTRTVASPRGRGVQLSKGAAVATGDWLLFLHSDTELAPHWRAEVARFAAQAGGSLRAGYFQFRLRSQAPQARVLEYLVAWRSRVVGLPYGDQGLLISRRLYDEIGGYRALPLMEDVDIVRRIGKSRLVGLPVAATTSAVRWERHGWMRRSVRNLICLGLYYTGLPPRLIHRIYG